MTVKTKPDVEAQDRARLLPVLGQFKRRHPDKFYNTQELAFLCMIPSERVFRALSGCEEVEEIRDAGPSRFRARVSA